MSKTMLFNGVVTSKSEGAERTFSVEALKQSTRVVTRLYVDLYAYKEGDDQTSGHVSQTKLGTISMSLEGSGKALENFHVGDVIHFQTENKGSTLKSYETVLSGNVSPSP